MLSCFKNLSSHESVFEWGKQPSKFSIIFPERLRLKCKYQPLICYSIHTTNMESILAVINTTELVVEMRPEKNSGPYEIWTHDLCDTGAATSSAVFITARIDSIFVFSTAVNTYDFHMFILFTTSENSTCDCQVSFFIEKILSNHCHTDRPIASVNDNWYCLLHTEMKDIWSRNEQSGVTMRPRNKKKSKRLSQSVILSLHQASMPLYSVWENARGVLRLCTMNMVFQGIPSLLWHKTWKPTESTIGMHRWVKSEHLSKAKKVSRSVIQ